MHSSSSCKPRHAGRPPPVQSPPPHDVAPELTHGSRYFVCYRCVDAMNAINSKFNDDREVVASENLQQAMLELLHEEEESVVRVKCIAGRVKLTVLVRNREDCAADEADALVDEEQEAPPLTPPPSQPPPQAEPPAPPPPPAATRPWPSVTATSISLKLFGINSTPTN